MGEESMDVRDTFRDDLRTILLAARHISSEHLLLGGMVAPGPWAWKDMTYTGLDHSRAPGLDHSHAPGPDHSRAPGLGHSRVPGLDHLAVLDRFLPGLLRQRHLGEGRATAVYQGDNSYETYRSV